MSKTGKDIEKIKAIEQGILSKLEEKNKEIKEIIHLGKINGKDLYRLTEIKKNDNFMAVIYKYFDENAQVIGVKNLRFDGEKEWIYSGEEWEQLRDEIDKSEAQLEEEIEGILSEYGISIDDIENITEVDLEQIVKEQEELDEVEELEDEEIEPKEKSKDDNKSKATSKYNNVLNEVETNKFVDQKGTELGEALGLQHYSKLLIVHADNVRDIKDADGKHYDTPTKRLAILGVREEKGKQVIEPISEDILDYDRRSNAHSVRFDDNSEVEKNTGTYERFVNPKTNRGISIEMSEMEAKVYYQGGIDLDDNTAVMGRVEDGRTGWVEAETKEIFNYNHGQYQQDRVNREIDIYDKGEGEENVRNRADGDLDNTSAPLKEIESPSDEIAFEGENMTVERAAEKMNIPVHMFIQEYNKRAKELDGEEQIDLEEDLYDEIEDRAEERLENEPKQEEGGYALGDDINQRGE